jgi:D-alanyl-D-alanine carboxypeptidase
MTSVVREEWDARPEGVEMRWRWRRSAAAVALSGLVLVCDASRTPAVAGPPRPSLAARAAVAMDRATGAILYAKNPDLRLPPASTTKVMTTVLALESGRLDESFRVSRYAASIAPSKIHVRPGTRVRLRDLAYAMMLNSANDASVVVAEGLGTSVAGFAAQMNRRAAALGARSTRFANPNGLPAEGHYSTARDIALIFRHALDVPHFRDIAGTQERRIIVTGTPRARTIELRNHNRLLHQYRVPVIGKTGYTRAARRCFVGAAAAEDREVVVALLGSTDLWGDARALLEYALARSPVVMADASPAGDVAGVENAVGSGEGDDDPETLSLAARPAGDPRTAARAPEGVAREYSVVLAPSPSRDAAERLRHFVGRRGHRAIVEAIGPPGARRYHVRVIGLPDRAAAERTATRLRTENLRPTVVPPGQAERAATR